LLIEKRGNSYFIYYNAKCSLWELSVIDTIDGPCQNIVVRTVNYRTLTMDLHIQSDHHTVTTSLSWQLWYDDFDGFFFQ